MSPTGEWAPEPPAAAAGKESSLPLDDPRVVQAVREYLAALEAGQKPDRRDVQARYPDIAGPLAECLDALEFMHAASPLAAAKNTVADSSPGVPPQAIPLGDYRILREAGRGGMGVVYEAQQLSLDRRVALKVLPFASALDAKQLQRFRNEAQAAAHLHHQNIVPVYAVGCERGVHYYAMQFIEGRTLAAVIEELRQFSGRDGKQAGAARGRAAKVITAGSGPTAAHIPAASAEPAHCPPAAEPESATTPTASLSTDHSTQTAAFFRTAARLGIQAAEALEHAHGMGVIHRDIKPANLLVDLRGNLWITDFGLAQIHGDNKLTLTGDLLGTLRYMSPEQALAQRVTVDQRTDVYSLGVTLYELLTLEPACNGPDRQAVLRQIAFEDPPHPRKLNRAIPLDLETIVLKAIAKNPAERYVTAREMAEDLQRYLRDEPVRARRPTLAQKLRKWAVRHQPVVWSAGVSLAVVFFILVAGLIYRNDLLDRKAMEIAGERDAAKTAATQAELINRFLMEFLAQAAPDRNARDQNVTAEQLFRLAAKKITGDPRFSSDPEVEASLRLTLGDTFYKLGALDEAEMHLRKAVDLRQRRLPVDHPDTLAAQERLADFLNRGRRKPDEAVQLSKQTYAARARVLGPSDPDTLDSMDTYGGALWRQGRLVEAERIHRDNLVLCLQHLGMDHERTQVAQNNLARLLMDKGEWREAEELLRQCFTIRSSRPRGMEKEETAITLANLCAVRLLLGEKLDDSAKELREAIADLARTHGRENLVTLVLQHRLVQVLLEKKNFSEAEKLGIETLNARRKILKPGDEDIGRSLAVLGRVLAEQAKLAQARPLLEEAADLFRKNYGHRQDLVAEAEHWLGVCLAAGKDFKRAEQLLLDSYKVLQPNPGVPARHKEAARQHIVELYQACGKPEQAAAWQAKR